LHYPHYELIVVDNAPATQATAELVYKFAENCSYLRYVREDHPGSSWARNRGILEAKGEIIAFTDDDVVVDPYWLTELARGFQVTENVACVTGQILPLELDTPAQFVFEAYGGFTRGFYRRIFDLREHRWNKPAYPYIIGACGTGASMAFTAAFLQSEGGFDPVLGVGTPTYGGVDIAAFFSVIIRGYRLVYQPTSLLYHQHRRNQATLQKQIYSYGIGLTAHITKAIIDRPLLLFDFINKCVCSLFYLAYVRLFKSDGEIVAYPFPSELKRLEWKGRLRGPLAYVQSRLAAGWTRKGLELVQESIANSRVEQGRK
jgi:glycosyltransferase involved in cell wall biosynthesis